MSQEHRPDLTLQILRRVGSPAGVEPTLSGTTPEAIRDEFQWAWENRIGLLYLLTVPERTLAPALLEGRESLIRREAETMAVLRRVCGHLNVADVRYVIFKTVRPYPFTPNDVDVLFLGTSEEYQRAVDLLMSKGYKKLGVAPLQTLAYDPAGEGKVGPKKEGGTYYLDLYRHAGADYFRYLDTHRAAACVQYLETDGIQIPILKPELELPVMLYHNVFPENTYHIEHFYLVLYYLYGSKAIDLDGFVDQTRRNHYVSAVRANLTITSALHERAFGVVPDRVQSVLEELGGADRKTAERLKRAGYRTPYYFRAPLFVGAAVAKLVEWNSLSSLFVQGAHMLQPRFMIDAVRAFVMRIKGAGVYEQA
ncbi:MAG: hypothetical protein ACYTEQ_09835 [Planctomycetota bacterium]